MFEKNLAVCRQGILRGRKEDGVTAFLGVPYAMPPVGALRWREPQAPASWRGVRSAEVHRAAPIQCGGRMENGVETEEFSEDCLYLNIWTAGNQNSRLPVFVWFYGGSYQMGNANDPAFDGRELAKQGIVVVTVQYRVNVFGFLCHPDMRRESPYGTGGNFGFLDQTASLRWVRENIAAFGGDPDAVTIAGQSAGSASVNNLMVSPLSRDLFHRAINQSGDVFQPERDITFDDTCAVGEALCAHFGVKTLDELRQLPAEAFVRRDYDVMQELGRFCTPVIDGVVIPASQGNLLLRGQGMPIPILLGSNTDEGSGGGPGYIRRVTARLEIPAELYPEDDPGAVRRLARDYWYARHYAWARIRTETVGHPTWHYVYSRQGARGAQHGDEIPFVFRTLPQLPGKTPTTEDLALMDVISGYWANFIKTGDPNGPGLLHWPRKTPGAGHLDINDTCSLQDDFIHEHDALLCPAAYRWMKARADGEIEG